jgi:carbonic anhydrase
MRIAKNGFLILAAILLQGQMQAAQTNSMTPEKALDELIKGNQRFMTDAILHPDSSKERRKETAVMQTPFATILGCSDSRVAPEIIFDQGIGDLFIVRVAGNVVGPVELDSIEYSALYLHSSILLVLGHQNCGAVDAVMNGKKKDIEAVADLIQPAVDKAKGEPGNPLENAIKTNVRMIVEQVRKSEVLKKLTAEKKFTVVGGYYNFQNGKVELLPETLK